VKERGPKRSKNMSFLSNIWFEGMLASVRGSYYFFEARVQEESRGWHLLCNVRLQSFEQDMTCLR
jgi:hypothetical protein